MGEELNTVYQRTLSRAADILGGKEKLRAYLRAPMHRLEAWLAGERPPMDIFLRVVDLIAASGTSNQLQRTEWLRQSSAQVLQESQRVLSDAGPTPRPTAGARRAGPVEDFFGRSFELADRREVLEAALEAAIGATSADMGNVQLCGPDGLRIVAQRGFDRPFLDYFAVVSEQASACGRALRIGQRVVVPDVASSEIFAGTPAAKVMAAAGARACQSTPLVAASGWTLGVISTHFHAPTTPSEEALARVEQIARRTAAWLETATAPGR